MGIRNLQVAWLFRDISTISGACEGCEGAQDASNLVSLPIPRLSATGESHGLHVASPQATAQEPRGSESAGPEPASVTILSLRSPSSHPPGKIPGEGIQLLESLGIGWKHGVMGGQDLGPRSIRLQTLSAQII